MARTARIACCTKPHRNAVSTSKVAMSLQRSGPNSRTSRFLRQQSRVYEWPVVLLGISISFQRYANRKREPLEETSSTYPVRETSLLTVYISAGCALVSSSCVRSRRTMRPSGIALTIKVLVADPFTRHPISLAATSGPAKEHLETWTCEKGCLWPLLWLPNDFKLLCCARHRD